MKIALAEIDLSKVIHEEPPRPPSRYLLAGSPTRCQGCQKPFERACIRGDDDCYYCSEVCAQVGLEIDFDKVVNS